MLILRFLDIYLYTGCILFKREFCLLDYRKTSLGPYLATFETFLKSLESSRKGKTIEQSGKYSFVLSVD